MRPFKITNPTPIPVRIGSTRNYQSLLPAAVVVASTVADENVQRLRRPNTSATDILYSYEAVNTASPLQLLQPASDHVQHSTVEITICQ